MDLLNIAEPTTILGLAALGIIAIAYVTSTMSDRFTKHLEEKDKNYQDFVLERNHQTGEIIEQAISVMVEVKESIKENTENTKQLISLHLKK